MGAVLARCFASFSGRFSRQFHDRIPVSQERQVRLFSYTASLFILLMIAPLHATAAPPLQTFPSLYSRSETAHADGSPTLARSPGYPSFSGPGRSPHADSV